MTLVILFKQKNKNKQKGTKNCKEKIFVSFLISHSKSHNKKKNLWRDTTERIGIKYQYIITEKWHIRPNQGMLPSHHRPALTESKREKAARKVSNYFPLCKPFSTEETLLAFRYSIVISVAYDVRSYSSYIQMYIH